MTTNLTIHRLLDGAFDGVPSTPETQDLKEELRANLVARVEDLEASGLAGEEAARRAFAELGDLHELLGDAAADAADRPEWDRHQVRLKAAFVVRATVAPLLGAVALALSFVVGAGGIPGGQLLTAALTLVWSFLIGFVTADSLQQEMSGSYPMPRPRAIGYGLGTGLLLAGVGAGAVCWWSPGLAFWAWLVIGGVLAVAGIGILAGLGATQTNRSKPWARELEAAWTRGEHPMQQSASGVSSASGVGNRFARDPGAAARFGIYTAVIWIVAIAAAFIIGFTLGWWWAPLAIVAAIVVMLLLLTQMLFRPER